MALHIVLGKQARCAALVEWSADGLRRRSTVRVCFARLCSNQQCLIVVTSDNALNFLVVRLTMV